MSTAAPMTWTDRVRGFMAQAEKAKTEEIIQALGAVGKQIKTVRMAIGSLVRRGEMVSEQQPHKWGREIFYHWAGPPILPERHGKQGLLWRAMCLKNQKAQPFSVADAARLAEADGDYAKRYCRFCSQQGFIYPVGRRGNARVYLVTPGKEREPAPRWNRRAEKRERTAGKNACATGAAKSGPLEILADMEAVLIAISGEALLLKGFLLEMRATVEAAAGGGHGAESGDQC